MRTPRKCPGCVADTEIRLSRIAGNPGIQGDQFLPRA
jgi:hypothetical protein